MSSGTAPESGAGRAAQRRLGALQLAALLGNVSEACRRLGIDRGSYYSWQRRFRSGGIEALCPRTRRERRRATKGAAAAAVVERAALAHPGWGCCRLARVLADEGVHLSPPTVQDALRRLGLPRRRDRALRLERLVEQDHVALNAEQIGLIERLEPGFRDRAAPACGPGEQLLQAAFYFGRVQGRRAYVHCALDAFSSFAFACVASGRRRSAVAASLLEECVSGLRQRGLGPRTVFTPDSPAFCGASARPYQRALRRCRLDQARTSDVRGQAERFRRHLLGDLLSEHHNLHLDETWDSLRERLGACLERYNSRPLDGHPNYGAAPRVRLGGVAVERTD